MSSLFNRSAVLIFARFTNIAVIFLSPVFLVRILDVTSYGEYREFVLYALLLATIFGFSINGSLLYFLPKDPSNENKYTTNTVLFLFIATIIGSIVVLLLEKVFSIEINVISIGYILLYVFFFVNLDMVESYWLAKKRSDYVFMYSTIRALVRVATVITSAYLTRDVEKVIYVMITVEILRAFLVFFWLLIRNILTFKLEWGLVKDQLKYILPLGAAAQMSNINQKAGGIFVVSQLGPEMLAIYTIGTFQLPVINVVRSAVSDVIFPDIVKHTSNDTGYGLELWQRANILFCFIVFPVFIVFFINANIFITTLFTNAYIEAAAVFRIMLLLMLRQCFEVSIPLRAKNKNSQFMFGNILALILNISMLSVAYEVFGIKGPAIALILSDLFLAIYLLRKIMALYSLSLGEVLLWKNVGKLILGALVPVPVLILSNYLTNSDLIWVVISSVVYGWSYLYIVRKLKLDDVELLMSKIRLKVNFTR